MSALDNLGPQFGDLSDKGVGFAVPGRTETTGGAPSPEQSSPGSDAPMPENSTVPGQNESGQTQARVGVKAEDFDPNASHYAGQIQNAIRPGGVSGA